MVGASQVHHRREPKCGQPQGPRMGKQEGLACGSSLVLHSLFNNLLTKAFLNHPVCEGCFSTFSLYLWENDYLLQCSFLLLDGNDHEDRDLLTLRSQSSLLSQPESLTALWGLLSSLSQPQNLHWGQRHRFYFLTSCSTSLSGLEAFPGFPVWALLEKAKAFLFFLSFPVKRLLSLVARVTLRV